ncbi:hypothetical protein EJB05_01768, partial [Eragrostis curvula]
MATICFGASLALVAGVLRPQQPTKGSTALSDRSGRPDRTLEKQILVNQAHQCSFITMYALVPMNKPVDLFIRSRRRSGRCSQCGEGQLVGGGYGCPRGGGAAGIRQGARDAQGRGPKLRDSIARLPLPLKEKQQKYLVSNQSEEDLVLREKLDLYLLQRRRLFFHKLNDMFPESTDNSSGCTMEASNSFEIMPQSIRRIFPFNIRKIVIFICRPYINQVGFTDIADVQIIVEVDETIKYLIISSESVNHMRRSGVTWDDNDHLVSSDDEHGDMMWNLMMWNLRSVE